MTEASKSYADALYALAMETGAEAATLDHLRTVMEELAKVPDALELFATPSIPRSERLEMLNRAFGETPEPVLGFLNVLVSRGDIRLLPQCLEAYETLHEAACRTTTAEVVSAVALTEEEKQALTLRLERKLNQTVRLQCSVDPTLLGGLVIQVDGKVIDGSLKHRLREIKEVMNR